MRTILLLHILTGGLGLLSGYVALSATKGASLHRKAGMLFVCVMLTMAVTGMMISAIGGIAPAINVPLSLLVIYMVVTSLTTVRPPAARWTWLDRFAMLAAMAIGVGCFVLAVVAIAAGGREAGAAYVIVPFGVVAMFASAGDRRLLRSGPLRGAPRLVRHLWRMCFALFVASIAFYAGGSRVPEMFRHPALLASGVLLPLVAMFYWRWRLARSGKAFGPPFDSTAQGRRPTVHNEVLLAK
jgi:uncharacterized membrane protein